MDYIKTGHPLRVARLLASVVIAVAMLGFAAVPRAHADDREDACRHRIEQANHRLLDAINHHGPTSSEADHARHELHEAREKCWSEVHKWWNEDDHRWHDRQDWDDYDRDHDHH